MINGLATTAKSAKAWLPLALLAVLPLGGWAWWTAVAVSATPTITSSPANPTSTATATFAYTASGATAFLCGLDAEASFATCPTSAITYAGLASGSHTLQVRAVEKTGRASNAASYAGVIDRMAPTVSSMSDMSATDPVQIPAGASVTLPTHSVAAPKIAMLNLTTNQNVCKNATFSLSYRGSAHS